MSISIYVYIYIYIYNDIYIYTHKHVIVAQVLHARKPGPLAAAGARLRYNRM